MRSVIFLVVCALVASLSDRIRVQADCRINPGPGSAISCSGNMSVEEIQAFLRSLEARGKTEFTYFYLYTNLAISHLPENFLGNMRLLQIIFIDYLNLVQVEDFLGASRHTVGALTFFHCALSEVPRLTAPKLGRLSISQEKHLVIRREIFAGMRDIGVLEFDSVSVEPLAFFDLKQLGFLSINSLALEPLVAGSFHFDSPRLSRVILSWNGEIEVGAFDGIPDRTFFAIMKAAEISPDIFYNVLREGATLYLTEPSTCDCQVAWIRLSSFVSHTHIPCSNGTSSVLLRDIDEAHFAHCGLGCSGHF